MDYTNVFQEYIITTNKLGIGFIEAYLEWKEFDHIILSKYEAFRAYLEFTKASGIPHEEALVSWQIHIIMTHMLYDFVP